MAIGARYDILRSYVSRHSYTNSMALEGSKHCLLLLWTCSFYLFNQREREREREGIKAPLNHIKLIFKKKYVCL